MMTTTFESTFEAGTFGLSQSELIRQFQEVDAAWRELGIRRRELGAALTYLAQEKRQDQNTVHLEAVNGQRVKVEFKQETTYEPDALLTVSELLGPERFDELFKSKLSFTAKLRNLKVFLNTVAAEERVETAKQVIKEATSVRETTSVTVTKS